MGELIGKKYFKKDQLYYSWSDLYFPIDLTNRTIKIKSILRYYCEILNPYYNEKQKKTPAIGHA